MTSARLDIPALAFALASALLAAAPLAWLVRSWRDPAYASEGWIFAAAVAGLAVWSIASGPAGSGRRTGGVIALLIGAAAARLAGQVLAINILSALALALDVLALARLARLDSRPFALSPLWLAALFLFALPLAAVVERAIGWPLQLVSASGACVVLGLFYGDLACAGTRLTLDGLDVLVDLPCAGASGLLTMLALTTGANAVLRPRVVTGMLALVVAAFLALVGNAFRIALLAIGLAERDSLGIDVMAEPWHSAIGLLALGLAALPMALWYRPRPIARRTVPQSGPERPAGRRASEPARLAAGFGVVAAALIIITAEARPVDVSTPVTPQPLPHQIAGHPGVPVALAPIERAYFTRYGGSAAKARYGALGLSRVTTRSALRHLHGPETCLRGLGYTVQPLATRRDGIIPSAVFKAEGPDGRLWQVRVTYVSESGRLASSVAEAVWHWFAEPGDAWTAIQRITPADLPEAERRALDRAVIAALDLTDPTAPGSRPEAPTALAHSMEPAG